MVSFKKASNIYGNTLFFLFENNTLQIKKEK